MDSKIDDVALTLDADERSREDVDASVERTWARSRAFGVDPDGRGHPDSIDVASNLVQRQTKLRGLIRSGSPVIEGLARDLARHHFALLLADGDGVVVRRMGGGEFEPKADAVRLIEGAHWAESVRGTNAIGTALAENVPVTVLGAAHYARPNQSLVCYASPIRDPAGETVAVLDATGVLSSADDFVSVAVRSAATALEDRLRLELWPQRGPNSLRVLQQTLERCAVPAFVVERPGSIRASNDSARNLLGRGPARLDALLGLQWSDLERLINVGHLSIDHAARLAQMFPHQQLHVEPVLDLRDDVWAAVVFIEPRVSGVSSPRPPKSPELPEAFESINGSDPGLRNVLQHAARVAVTSLPVLVCSETGTGKELLARAIHEASQRSGGPMVSLNCGAVQPELMASELFGYAPGAFTGADPKGREGKLAAAASGTLFLDELGEMPSALQILLLRFLESGSYQRVGESKLRHVDVRLICATCQDLESLVESGAFRQDLYYRIKGACLRLPPLRARDDLPELADALLDELVQSESIDPRPRLTPAAQMRLSQHDWPGNTRELKMVLHHALALSRGREFIDASELPLSVSARPKSTPRENTGTLRDQKKAALAQALQAAGGNISAAARSLGVARSTIYRQLQRYGLLE